MKRGIWLIGLVGLVLGTGPLAPLAAAAEGLELRLAGNPSRGSAEAPLALIEFTDYRDPFCAKASEQVLPSLVEPYLDRGELRHVVMGFPIHPGSQESARAAECAHRQGRFWDFHRRLLANGGTVAGALGRPAGLGLERQELERCVGSEDAVRAVEADAAEARRLGLPGVPSFVLAAADPYRPGLSRVLAVLPGARREPIEAAIRQALADPPRFEPPQPLTLHAVELEPASVGVGEQMTLAWELTANGDGAAGDGAVEVLLAYAILQDGKSLFRSEPRAIRIPAGRRMRSEARVPAKAPGSYSLVAFARVGAIEKSAETRFRVQ